MKAVPKKIGVAHIMKTINEVYGGGGARASGQAGSAQTVPLQQKLAICALILTLNKGRSKEVALGKVGVCVTGQQSQCFCVRYMMVGCVSARIII